ncbi:DUF2270 domain-containing protein [Haloglomus litoreum]|uniref:DUF2270 domain-containing protein n=1 Tax=Haloglomus litoreum TaxID=3034026 RepID=UPI0023E8073A|nr:DUF2270 domain-containing protein [Haloglomus sp. DT116]
MLSQEPTPRESGDTDESSDSDADRSAGRAAGAGQRSPGRPAPDGAGPDPFVGQGLLDSEMGPSSAMAHLYRGEIHRMKFWRERLDRTTNWAVIVLAAVLTWAFSSEQNPHYLLLIGNVVLATFLVIEARRYRAYDIWRSRVRTLQQQVWATGLDEGEPTDADWRADLAEDYRQPTIKITAEEAIAHRLRRIYLPLLAVLDAAWVVRVTAFGPEPWPASAAIGVVPGTVVTGLLALLFAAAVVVACRPRTWHADAELRTEALRKERGAAGDDHADGLAGRPEDD